MNWLSLIEFGRQQTDLMRRREPNTGQHLRVFIDWLETPKKLLFCPGIPGAGKTIQAAVVVDYLRSRYRDEPKVGMAYVYCDFRRQHEQDSDELLACITQQLLSQLDTFPGEALDLYEKHRKAKTRPARQEIFTLLSKLCAEYHRVFLVMDALDECSNFYNHRQVLLDQVFQLRHAANVNVFSTSRFLPEIQVIFEDAGAVTFEREPLNATFASTWMGKCRSYRHLFAVVQGCKRKLKRGYRRP